MTTQHTPAPWMHHLGRGKNPRFHIQMMHGYQIASTPEISRAEAEATEQEANARLIAAAPELLSALQNIVKANANFDDLTQPLLDAEAAIAKATTNS